MTPPIHMGLAQHHKKGRGRSLSHISILNQIYNILFNHNTTIKWSNICSYKLSYKQQTLDTYNLCGINILFFFLININIYQNTHENSNSSVLNKVYNTLFMIFVVVLNFLGLLNLILDEIHKFFLWPSRVPIILLRRVKCNFIKPNC